MAFFKPIITMAFSTSQAQLIFVTNIFFKADVCKKDYFEYLVLVVRVVFYVHCKKDYFELMLKQLMGLCKNCKLEIKKAQVQYQI